MKPFMFLISKTATVLGFGMLIACSLVILFAVKNYITYDTRKGK